MCERKYQQYEIVVRFSNGDKEEINMLNETEINKSNYKEMLKVYSEVKEIHKDKECVIEFCGSSNDSSLNVIFTKELKRTEDIETITNDIPIKDSIQELTRIVKHITERSNFLDSKLSLLSKQQDFLLHRIELSDENVSLDEIVSTYNEMRKIRLDRREVKNERNIIQRLENKGIMFNFNRIANIIDNVNLDNLEAKVEKAKEQAKEIYIAPLEENQLIRTIPFKTHKERMHFIKQMEIKYDKIIVDDERKIITCYNKCKSR